MVIQATGARPVWYAQFSRSLSVAIGALVSAGVSISPAFARDVVTFKTSHAPGTVVIRTSERKLYYVEPNGRAVEYRVAVGRSGKQWTGKAKITGKYVSPAWGPPLEIKRDNPSLPDVIPGGSPRNPLGSRALTLDRGQYAIHGTNRPGSIGTFASYGCIRMLNDDIEHLFERVSIGTSLIVTR